MGSTPQNESSGRSDNDRRLLAGLKEINAAVHKWRDELTAILEPPPATPEGKQAAITEQLKRKPQIEEFVSSNLAAIRKVFAEDLNEHEWGAAVLVELDLGWQDISNHWVLDVGKPELAMETLRVVRDKLDGVIYTCLANILAPDINDRLLNLEIGQPLDLEFVYGGDFPRDPKMRKRLILELAQERGAIESGWFDAESGLTYRIAATPKERRKAIWHLSGLLLLGGLLAAGACLAGLWIPAWPIRPYQFSTVTNYVFLFLGVGAQTVIQALKQNRARAGASFTALDDWPLWLHVHEKQVLYSVLWADVGFVLLTAMVPDMDWKGAFVAGYGIDSITDLFLSRFEGVIGGATARLKAAAA